MNRNLVPPDARVAVSIIKTAKMIVTEADRLQLLYFRARRRRLGWKKGKRPGPKPDYEVFILEARSRVFSGRNLSHSKKADVDRKLFGKIAVNTEDQKRIRLKRLDRWRSSYQYQQMCWQENFENLHEAQRIGRLIIQKGSLSATAIQQTRGLSKRRLDELIPLVLGWNARLELHVRGKRRVFRALAKGSPELAARISEINRRVEERSRPIVAS